MISQASVASVASAFAELPGQGRTAERQDGVRQRQDLRFVPHFLDSISFHKVLDSLDTRLIHKIHKIHMINAIFCIGQYVVFVVCLILFGPTGSALAPQRQ